jgi:hypothetical protein
MPVCSSRKKLPFAVRFVQHKAKNAPRKFLPKVVLRIKKNDPAKKFLFATLGRQQKLCRVTKGARHACERENFSEPALPLALRVCPARGAPLEGALDLSLGRHAGLLDAPACAVELNGIATSGGLKITRWNSYISSKAINNVPTSYAVVRDLLSQNSPGEFPSRQRQAPN